MNNEAYTINTSQGQYIVPVRDTVDYKNIKFLGFQHYEYHSIMSQNLANIVDDLSILKDGGAAQATYQLDEMLSDAKAQIDIEISEIQTLLNSTIDERITFNVHLINNAILELQDALGSAGSGLVNRVEIVEQTLVHPSTGLIYYVNQLKDIIGNSNIGLVSQVQVNIDSIDQLESIIGDDTKGLVKLVNSLNEKALITNDQLLNIKTILGDASSGLVYLVDTLNNIVTNPGGLSDQVSELNTTAASHDLSINQLLNKSTIWDTSVTTLSTLLDNFNNLVTTVTGIDTISSSNATDIVTLQQNFIDLQTELTNVLSSTNSSSTAFVSLKAIVDSNVLRITDIENALTSTDGIINRLDNMPNLIKDQLLTYSGTYFSPIMIDDMYNISQDIKNNNLVSQFREYFHDGLNFIPSEQIGREMLDLYRTSPTGLVVDVTNILNGAVGGGLTTLTNSVNVLNGDESTLGSVDYKLEQYNQMLHNEGGSIYNIMADHSVQGSIDNKVSHNTQILTTTEIDPLKGRVSLLEQELDTGIVEKIEEVQLESMRYSHMLPILRKLFKLVNETGSVTNTEIDQVFDYIETGLASVHKEYDIKFYYVTSTQQLVMAVSLDINQRIVPFNDEHGIYYASNWFNYEDAYGFYDIVDGYATIYVDDEGIIGNIPANKYTKFGGRLVIMYDLAKAYLSTPDEETGDIPMGVYPANFTIQIEDAGGGINTVSHILTDYTTVETIYDTGEF